MAGLILRSSRTDAKGRPTGEYLLVVIGYYSRYYEIQFLTSVIAFQIILRLENTLAVHGLPVSITSDNEPQFRSEEFKRYLVDNDILHHKVTKLWTQANGEMRRQNRSLLESMKIALAKGKDWRKEIVRYLQPYNSTQCHGRFPGKIAVRAEDTLKVSRAARSHSK